MGFFKRHFTRHVLVEPKHLGPELNAHVKAQATQEATGANAGESGFVVSVLRIPDENIGEGIIDDLTGRVRFNVGFDAVCFKPFRNEVMDTVVLQCTSQGFFSEAGPFTLFVSRIHIPGDMEFRAEDSSWTAKDSELVLKAGSIVRLRIMGVNAVLGSIAGIGTINEGYLGVLV
jgi:DNA-directed RNA polymerase II subunit RPB7